MVFLLPPLPAAPLSPENLSGWQGWEGAASSSVSPLFPLHAPFLREPLNPGNPGKSEGQHVALSCVQVFLSPFSTVGTFLKPSGVIELHQREQNQPAHSPSSQMPVLPWSSHRPWGDGFSDFFRAEPFY